MVRTLEGALELIHAEGLITEIPAHGVHSLAEAVIGGPFSGSVWRHAKGNLIYRLGRYLRASPEVLAVRLWEGKMTFVDRRLWPEVYRVVMEPTRRRPALLGLSRSARDLLGRVECEGDVQLPHEQWTKEREALEERLLVQSSDLPVDGRYWARLQSWRRWASTGVRQLARSISYAEALRALSPQLGEAPPGPWLTAP